MPNYDFYCKECDTTVEIFITIHGVQDPRCDKCGMPLKKVIAPTPVHFKGTGWGSSK